MRKKALLVGMMVAFSWFPVWAAAQQEVERRWSEIPLVVDHEVALPLPDGTSVQGKVIAVRADALEMDVKKTSDKRLHPKGKTAIPRSSISVIEVHTKRSKRFPIGAKVVGGAGTLGGLILGGYLGEKMNGADGILVGMAVGTVVGAIGGVLAGRRLDDERETTLIRVAPEAPATEKLPVPAQTGSEVMELDDSGFSVRNPHARAGWAF